MNRCFLGCLYLLVTAAQSMGEELALISIEWKKSLDMDLMTLGIPEDWSGQEEDVCYQFQVNKQSQRFKSLPPQKCRNVKEVSSSSIYGGPGIDTIAFNNNDQNEWKNRFYAIFVYDYKFITPTRPLDPHERMIYRAEPVVTVKLNQDSRKEIIKYQDADEIYTLSKRFWLVGCLKLNASTEKLDFREVPSKDGFVNLVFQKGGHKSVWTPILDRCKEAFVLDAKPQNPEENDKQKTDDEEHEESKSKKELNETVTEKTKENRMMDKEETFELTPSQELALVSIEWKKSLDMDLMTLGIPVDWSGLKEDVCYQFQVNKQSQRFKSLPPEKCKNVKEVKSSSIYGGPGIDTIAFENNDQKELEDRFYAILVYDYKFITPTRPLDPHEQMIFRAEPVVTLKFNQDSSKEIIKYEDAKGVYTIGRRFWFIGCLKLDSTTNKLAFRKVTSRNSFVNLFFSSLGEYTKGWTLILDECKTIFSE